MVGKSSIPWEIASLWKSSHWKGSQCKNTGSTQFVLMSPDVLAGCEENDFFESSILTHNSVQDDVILKPSKFHHFMADQCEINEVVAKWLVDGSPFSVCEHATRCSKCFACPRNVFLHPKANLNSKMMLKIYFELYLGITPRKLCFWYRKWDPSQFKKKFQFFQSRTLVVLINFFPLIQEVFYFFRGSASNVDWNSRGFRIFWGATTVSRNCLFVWRETEMVNWPRTCRILSTFRLSAQSESS